MACGDSGFALEEPPVPLLDAHLHLWDPRPRELPGASLTYSWMNGRGMPETSRPEDALVPCGGAIVVEAGADPRCAGAELRWLGLLAEARPWIRGIVAQVDLRSTELDRELEGFAALGQVVGLRHNLEGCPEGWIASQRIGSRLTRLAPAGFAADLCLRADQLDEMVGELEHARPERIVLDHLGKPALLPEAEPDEQRDALRDWSASLRRLAETGDVSCKISGLWSLLGRGARLDAAAPRGRAVDAAARAVEMALDAFGGDRVLLGSDHPVSTAARGVGADASWRMTLEAFARAAGHPAGADALHATAERVYRPRPHPRDDEVVA